MSEARESSAAEIATRDAATVLRNCRRMLNRLVPRTASVAARMGVVTHTNGGHPSSNDLPGMASDCEVMITELTELVDGVDRAVGPTD